MSTKRVIPKTSKTRAAHDCQRRCLLFDKFLPPSLSLLYFARAALPLTIQKACYPPRYYYKFSCYENREFKVVFSFLEQLETESSTLINTETTFNGQSVRRVNLKYTIFKSVPSEALWVERSLRLKFVVSIVVRVLAPFSRGCQFESRQGPINLVQPLTPTQILVIMRRLVYLSVDYSSLDSNSAAFILH